MSIVLKGLGLLLVIGAAYLSLWPVPIDPQPWTAPPDQGFTGAFAANDRLSAMDYLSIGEFHGPEDVVLATENGREIAYTTSQDGVILRIDTAANSFSVFARTGGVPLGMERDEDGNFIIADAFKGLISVSADGSEVKVLTDSVDGTPINYADDLAIANDGIIYFSDASTKFGAEEWGSTLAASLLEISEHGRTGRILSYDTSTGKTAVVATGYSFSNGVALCPDSACILVNETGEYSIDKIYIAGPRAGEIETIVESLPGFPDNINPGSVVDGRQTYWLGLASPRVQQLDDTDRTPFLRALSYRLPESMRIAPANYGIVVQIDADGHVLQTLQDPDGNYPVTTGAIEGNGWLYITSLQATRLGRVAYP